MNSVSRSTPTFADVTAAAARIKGVAVETPFIESPALNERLQARVFLKLELLQRTGSFKFRGAYNRLVQLYAGRTEARRGRVLLGQSRARRGGGRAPARHAGHDRHALRRAAHQTRRTRARSAPRSIFYDRKRDKREEIAARLASEKGAVVVPAFDDPRYRRRAGHGRARDRAPGARSRRQPRCGARAVQRRRIVVGRRTRAVSRKPWHPSLSPSSPKASTARGCPSNGASGPPRPETATASPIR